MFFSITPHLLSSYIRLSEIWTSLHPRGLLSDSKPGTTYEKLPKDCNVFLVREDSVRPTKTVNVFSINGEQVYSFERSSNSHLWIIYHTSDRIPIGNIFVSLKHRAITFYGKSEIYHRQIGQPRALYAGLPDRRFYLTDGTPYEWSRESKFLEHIINPGGGHEEVRQRIAKVRGLRNGGFDWEVSIDPEFDSEVALATSFISMLTAWSCTSGETGSRLLHPAQLPQQI